MRKAVYRVGVGIALTVSVFCATSAFVVLRHQNDIVAITDVQTAPVAIVLGAKVKANDDPSDILRDRLLTGIDLYTSGKVSKLLLSGDDGQIEYDEVNAMREFALEYGVDADDIFLDHAGFDTYDSMARASKVFGVTSAIVVTQEYHLPRALYLAHAFGIDAQGVVADKQTYRGIVRYQLREYLADVKAVLNVIFRTAPTYLGEPIDITGDGQVTWDEGK